VAAPHIIARVPNNDRTFVPASVSPSTVGGVAPAPLDTVTSLSQFGNYEVLGELARGGVGVIYRARQKGLERVVALKVLQGGTMASQEQVQRFLNEAQAAAKLQHPNIVPIHEFGSNEGQYFFTMDFVEGKSLADMMANGPIPAREALEIVRQTAEALHYAHDRGVIHRDIKPGNILIDLSGRVKITDFGIAKEVTREQLHLTMEGQVMGTPRYMSPEQASGKTALADRRSDVFSLGATFYEMLTGTAVFDAENVYAVLQKVVTLDPPAPHKVNRKVHRDVSTICLKALEKRPERRYETAQEMADDIKRFLDGEPIEARPVSVFERGARKAVRHWKAVVVNTAIFAAAAYGVWFYLQSRPGHLRIELQPTLVNVALDGSDIACEELEKGRELAAGTHELHAELEPTHDPVTLKFELRPGERRVLPVTLHRRRGQLVVTTDPPDAGITVIGPDGYHAPFRGPRVEQTLPTGPYAVLVHRENYLAKRTELNIERQQTSTLHFALPAVTLWSVPTSGNVLSVPAAADMDGDGWTDVVAGDDDGRIYCLSGRNGVALWVFNARDAVQAPLSLADLNRDGVPDVIVGSTDGTLYCLSGKTGQALWSFATRGAILGPTLLRDVNGDLLPDAITGSADGNVYAVSGKDGAMLWRYATKDRIESCLAWARAGDTEMVVAGSADKTLYALAPRTGRLLWSVEIGMPLLFPPRIENGTVLVPTPRGPGDIRTATPVMLANGERGPASDSLPESLDLDGDGQPEKLVISDKGTSVFAADGKRLVWSCDYQAVSAYAADANSDGWLDLVFNNGPDELLCLSGANGDVLGRIKLESSTGRGLALADVDRDGVPDVAIGAGRKLSCFSWVGSRQQWRTQAAGYYDVPCVATDGRVFAKTQTGEIACFDPTRSEPIWKIKTSPQPASYAGMTAGEGMIVDADASTRLVRALAVKDGKPIWQGELTGGTGMAIGWPLLRAGNVVVGDGQEKVVCLTATNGAVRWSARIGEVTAQPAIGSDAVFVADRTDRLFCLALSDGKERWQFKAPTADPFPSAPALVDINADGVEDAIGANDNGYIYALDGRTGQVLWQMEHAPVTARSRNRLVAVNGLHGVLANAKGDVLWLNLREGKLLWRSSVRAAVLGEVAIADMNFDGVADAIVGTMARRLHCLSGKNGAELWTYEVGAQIRHSAPLLVKLPQDTAPHIFIGTGPPENGLYCLRGSCLPSKPREWLSPWPK